MGSMIYQAVTKSLFRFLGEEERTNTSLAIAAALLQAKNSASPTIKTADPTGMRF
jgi:hypothetical protein